MAIKYKTQTGYSHINDKARTIRDYVLKPNLAGMRCTNCGGDSEVTFEQHQGFANSNSVDWVFHACCEPFEAKVYQKLGVTRRSNF